MKGFLDYLREIDKGRLSELLTVEIRSLVEAVSVTSKKGTLKLTIEISPHKSEGVVILTGKIDAKIPKDGAKPAIYWINPENYELSRSDPRQMDISETLHSIEGNGKKKH